MKHENSNCKSSCCYIHQKNLVNNCEFVISQNVIWSNITKSDVIWPAVISLQSCHIGEDDEGGDQEGEEPSFEVRQTEMVWGDQGRGDRGVSGEATPQAVTPRHHTRHSPPPQLFFSLPVFFSCSLTPLVDFLLWWTDLCMPLLDSCPSVGSMLRTQFVLFFLNCMTWVQRDGAAKDNKMKPRSKQTTESLLGV